MVVCLGVTAVACGYIDYEILAVGESGAAAETETAVSSGGGTEVAASAGTGDELGSETGDSGSGGSSGGAAPLRLACNLSAALGSVSTNARLGLTLTDSGFAAAWRDASDEDEVVIQVYDTEAAPVGAPITFRATVPLGGSSAMIFLGYGNDRLIIATGLNASTHDVRIYELTGSLVADLGARSDFLGSHTNLDVHFEYVGGRFYAAARVQASDPNMGLWSVDEDGSNVVASPATTAGIPTSEQRLVMDGTTPIIVWRDHTSPRRRIRFSTYNAAGNRVSISPFVDTTPDLDSNRCCFNPDAVLIDGKFAVAWHMRTSSTATGDRQVMMRFVDGNAASVAPTPGDALLMVDGTLPQGATSARLHALPGGGLRLIYLDEGPDADTDSNDLFALELDANGTATGPATLLAASSNFVSVRHDADQSVILNQVGGALSLQTHCGP